MRTQWAREGRPSTLNCTLREPEGTDYSLEWRRDGQLIHSSFSHEDGHSAPSLQGRIARSEGLGLTIHAVRREDEAVYGCSLTVFLRASPTSPLLAPPIRLVVNTRPVISEPSNGEVLFAEVGKPLEVRCTANAVPPAEVSWLKNGRIFSGHPILIIHNVSIADQGAYSCLAANSEGRVESTIAVRLPKRVHFDYPPQNQTVVAGSSAFWNCHATGFPDRINYQWTFNGQPVKTTSVGLRARVTKGELAIRDVQKADGGRYTCHASNTFGESTADAYLDVQYIPSVLETNSQVYTLAVGGNATLSCKADANPAITMVNWTKNGHFLATKDKETLELIDVTTEDAGLYTCEPFNRLGQGTPYEMHVIVAYPPVFVLKPPPEIRVKQGQRISMKCSGFADPQPIQYWVRNQVRTSSEELVIEQAGYEHDGNYECVVSNAVASIRAQTKILVENTRPHPPIIKDVECEGETGLRVKWKPGFDGGHTQRFLLHVEEQGEEGESGMRRRVETDDQEASVSSLSPFGKYRLSVEAVNQLGSANSSSVERHVCTRLSSPEDARLEGDRIVWQEVQGAHSYRIEMRTDHGQYSNLGEVLQPQFSLSSLSRVSEDTELRVFGLRPPFPPSPPSRPVSISIRETPNDTGPFVLAFCGGVFMFVLLVLLYFLARRKSDKMKRKHKKSNSPTFHNFGCSVHTPQIVRQMYEPRPVPMANIVEDDAGSEWSGASRDHVVRCVRGPYSSTLGRSTSLVPYDPDVVSVERDSVIGDMLRTRYLTRTPDGKHTALIDELRLARLKKEYKQSQL